MLPRALTMIALCAGLLSACGGSSDGASAGAGCSAPPATPQAPQGNALALPANVPLQATGKAQAGCVEVIRAWSDALRKGDVAAASAQWAVPSKVQNGTPVLTLSNRSDVRIFNDALSCGSVVTATGGAEGGFTIVTVRLTQRPGADCGSGTGQSARTAILVRGGKIAEWYRLPDDPSAPAPQPQAPPGAPSDGSPDTTVI